MTTRQQPQTNQPVEQQLKQSLKNVQFPATRQEIMEQCGEQSITQSNGQSKTLRECLSRSRQDRFQSEQEVSREVQQNLI